MSSSLQPLATLTELVNGAFLRLGRLFSGAAAFMQQAAPTVVRLDNPFPNRPRVMVVDDYPENRLLLEALLYRWGIRPAQAADGAEAVALACGQHFDLILMDLQMPILDGVTAAAQIRRFERERGHPRAPIVACTSSALGGDWQALRASGFDESLEKPCSAQSLEDCLQRWCGDGLRKAFETVTAQ